MITKYHSLVKAWLVCTSLLAASYAHAHAGHTDKAALEACENAIKSQACQYSGGHDDLYIGSCQYISDDDLTCVRNQPIQKIIPKKD